MFEHTKHDIWVRPSKVILHPGLKKGLLMLNLMSKSCFIWKHKTAGKNVNVHWDQIIFCNLDRYEN